MKIFTSIVNAVRGGSGAKVAAQPEAGPGAPPIPGGLGGVTRGGALAAQAKADEKLQRALSGEKEAQAEEPKAPEPSKLTPFEQKWIHLEGGAFGLFLKPEFLDFILDCDRERLQPIIDKVRADLAPHVKVHRETIAQICEASHAAVQAEFHRLHAENLQAQRAGDYNAVQEIPTRDNLIESFGIRRAALRQKIRAITAKSWPIVTYLMGELAKSGQVAADRLEAEERAKAQKFGIPFEPSEALKTIAWASIRGFAAQGKFQGGSACPDFLLNGWIKI